MLNMGSQSKSEEFEFTTKISPAGRLKIHRNQLLFYTKRTIFTSRIIFGFNLPAVLSSKLVKSVPPVNYKASRTNRSPFVNLNCGGLWNCFEIGFDWLCFFFSQKTQLLP